MHSQEHNSHFDPTAFSSIRMATSTQTHCSSSSYDVFLSFRGADTRKTFTDHLYAALLQNGIRTFRDEEELEIGEPITPNLLKSIQESRISIPIISPDYASSRSCLGELAKIMKCKQTIGQIVLPIFYHVDVGDVKKQTGSFGQPFCKHEERFEMETVLEWRNALREAGELKGWDLKNVQNGHEARVIQLVLKQVLCILNNTSMDVAKHPIGIDSRMEEMMRRLDIGSQDVLFVGIHGMGGLGKTTIAKAIFNKIHRGFDGSSFIRDVRAHAQDKGLVYLQNKLISDILKQENDLISDVDIGKNKIKERMCTKKVLVILDDVDEIVQLEALAGKSDWFGYGSMIIITTRDKHVLNVPGMVEEKIYNPEQLDENQSLQLFSLHAFGRDQPLEDFIELSKKVALAAGGLPLALEVLGSFLFDKRRPIEWEDALEKLRRIPLEEIMEKLKISYDALDPLEKEIFLDIACLLIGTDKEIAIKIWEGCNFFPKIGIEVLVHKSLIKISDENNLMMHDQLRDMGRAIVYQQSPKDLGKQSRLWSHDEALDVVKKKKGTEKMEGLTLNFEGYWSRFGRNKPKEVLRTKAFAAMSNLRLLRINNGCLVGSFEHLPPELRWLSLSQCALKFTLNNFHLENITVLDLSKTNITQLGTGWHQNKVAEKLKLLNLKDCYKLTRTPNFSQFPNLEKLILKYCINLVKLHTSIGHLNSLLLLDLSWCSKLKELPTSICNLTCLERLDLTYCSKLNKLPDSIGLLKKLQTLELFKCESLKKLPDSLGELESLTKLELDYTAVREIPVSIGSLKKLETLTAENCRLLTILPNSIGGLESLLDFKLSWTSILELPDSISLLLKLRCLSLLGCQSLCKLPDSLGRMVSLIQLDLRSTLIKEIPDFHVSQNKLESLLIGGCKLFSRLPESIGNVRNLKTLEISESILTEIPDGVCSLEKLESLCLLNCKKLVKLPDSMGKLKLLKRISIRETGIVELPKDFGMLSSLIDLEISFCPEFKGFPESFGSLTQLMILDMRGNSKLIVLPNSFLSLCSLQRLYARDCNLSGLGAIPVYFGGLSSLKVLDLSYNNFCSLPTSISHLSLLEDLSLQCCTQLESLPDLSNFKSLKELRIDQCYKLESLLDLSNLVSLKELSLDECYELESLPELPTGLIKLSAAGCKSMARLPDLSNLVSLKELRLDECYKLESLPELPTGLIKLSAADCKSMARLPDLSNLRSLEELCLFKCCKLESVPELPTSLIKLNVAECKSMTRLPDLSSLKSLGELDLVNCSKLSKIQGLDRLESLQTFNTSGCSISAITLNKIHLQGWLAKFMMRFRNSV